jgi:hypothetical protein
MCTSQLSADVAREIDLAEISHAAADTSGTSSHKLNKLMCVAAGGDHAAIWVDSSSSAVIADDSRGTAPRRFDDCSLHKKCEIAVMGHDPVLLADCIQVCPCPATQAATVRSIRLARAAAQHCTHVSVWCVHALSSMLRSCVLSPQSSIHSKWSAIALPQRWRSRCNNELTTYRTPGTRPPLKPIQP